MSWDIILFNSRQIITSSEEIDDALLVPTHFCEVLETNFPTIIKEGNHRIIRGENYEIEYFSDDMPVSNKMLSLYGENGLFEIAVLAKKQNWQIFDTGIDKMIDLDNPANNGYEHFQSYVSQLLKKKV